MKKKIKYIRQTFAGQDIEIFEGMPCTISIGSDRYAAKVIELLSPRRIRVVEEYALERDPNAPGMVWSLRKNGKWRPKGELIVAGGHRLTLGTAVTYLDPSF